MICTFNGETFGKGKLVLAVVKDYVSKNPNTTFDELKKAFPDEWQDSRPNPRFGVFVKLSDAEKHYEATGRTVRFFMKEGETIQLSDEAIVVSTQWGIANIGDFVDGSNQNHNTDISVAANFEIVSKEEPVSKRKYIGQGYYEGDDLTKNKAEPEGTGTDFPSNDMDGDDDAETKLMEKVIKWVFWWCILPVAVISIVIVSTLGMPEGSPMKSDFLFLLIFASVVWIGLCFFVSLLNDLFGDKRRTPKSIARKMKGKK